MTPLPPSPTPRAPAVQASATARWLPWARLGAFTTVSAVASAGMGYGLQHSLPQAPWAAAVIGGSVGLLMAPLLLWARAQKPLWTRSPRRPAAPVVPVRVAASNPAATDNRAVRDSLTGAYTQQHFVAATDREWSRIRRHGEDAALLMVDLDHFKALNDRWGMPCGDALLVEATRQVATTLRQYDLLARFGGGVLVVYLPHADPLGALDVAERLRERVAGIRMAWQGETVRATVSVGVAAIGASHASLDEAIADAGSALREAKSAGRNCVRAAPIPPRRGAGSGLPLGDHRRAGPV